MNSEKLQRYVMEELAFDPRVDSTGIAVKVDDRIVTLVGYANSATDKNAIIEAVKRLKGVRGIVVDIVVRCPPECHVPDEQIVERATQMLAWRTDIPRDAVKVTVDAGCMTLSGTVDWQFQRQAIENDFKFLAGVVSVKNEIQIRHVSCTSDIYHSITEALHRLADADTAQIHVNVDGTGHVILRGKVADWRARNAVEDAAWLVAGVKDVDNLVTVR